MFVLIINSGSSSIKYQLIDMPSEELLCKGMVDRIGLDGSTLSLEVVEDKKVLKKEIGDHEIGLSLVVSLLLEDELTPISNRNEIKLIGHRVVHGGSQFSDTVLIDERVKSAIKDLFDLAPLHNPANLTGIEVAERLFPNATQVAVFDTAFHQTIPDLAYKYAIPTQFLNDHNIRLYGFHGTSHKYVSEKTREFLRVDKAKKIITIHLGNGCSMTAIQNGKSIDHSLGFGPMNGLIMGTRSGDIDQSVVLYLMSGLNMSLDEVTSLLQKQSGMLGLTGYSDLREIQERADNGDVDCKLALLMSAYRIKKYIGAYAAIMNGLDAIVFTAGIGENSSKVRSLVCNSMDYLGIILDETKNKLRNNAIRAIHESAGKVAILVVPTNEELEIAKQSFKIFNI
ncbi:acetate/propionate family kinase [Spongiivirga citrea]|uniref:Acetate kinase n=1 Tax=Spongiivirga citrea TaxID=1481457 RepID=A0A6M0CDH1_9FLAO|nr:acetate kinase [Spongiivirga citrea]NER15846.1 acetate/propionate family kinase [Spongiivirga citrea]